MGRRIGERMNRRTRGLTAVVAGSLLLGACSYEPQREQIDFLKPVGSMTPVATAPAAHEVAPGPSYETNMRNSTSMLVCLGAFVDKAQKKVTILPVSDHPPDSQAVFPARVDLKQGGGSGIYPPSAAPAPKDFEWYDLNGKSLGNTQPTCEERPVRLTRILLPHGHESDIALVGPHVDQDAVLDLTRPGVAEKSSIYSRQYDYGTPEDLRTIARDLQATS